MIRHILYITKPKLTTKVTLLMLCLAFTLKTIASDSSSSNEQTAGRNLFIEWKSKDSTIILGYFNKNRLKRIPAYRCKLKDLTQVNIEKWLGETDDGSALLLFHCMWGQQATFHKKKYLIPLKESFDDSLSPGPQTEISFIWHAGGLNYLKNYEEASIKGEALTQVVSWISKHYNNKIHAFCHSMGSRFFEGVVRNRNESINFLFENIILFSADISNDVDDPDFLQCLGSSKNIYVYMHSKDKLLWVSSILNREQRLGRSGPNNTQPIDKLYVVDITGHAGGFINHTHTTNAWVKSNLRSIFKKGGVSK